MPSSPARPPVPSAAQPDVDGSEFPSYDLSYRDRFWPARAYEDRCDRMALRALLPRAGERLVDIGAGFGRLVDEYTAFEEVTLADTSPEMLEAARERVREMPHVRVVGADAAHLPMADRSVDVVVSVRLLVHVADPSPVFREVARVLRPGGTFILEYPNRRHVLSIVRHAIRRQAWSPAGADPIEYLPGHFAHQPATIESKLRAAGLAPDARRAVSLFRAPILKRFVPTGILAAVERPLQGVLGPVAPSPAVYIRSVRLRSPQDSSVAAAD